MVAYCAMREINEELDIDVDSGIESGHAGLDMCGLIYDPSNEVGRVHGGVVLVYTPTLMLNEYNSTDDCPDIKLHGTSEELLALDNTPWPEYETWSQICITNMDAIFSHV
jgi:predicted NUDIX family phosphoesterase